MPEPNSKNKNGKNVSTAIRRAVTFFLLPASVLSVLVSVFNLNKIFRQWYELPNDHILAIVFPPCLVYIISLCYNYSLRGKNVDLIEEIERHRKYVEVVESCLRSTIGQLTDIKDFGLSEMTSLTPSAMGRSYDERAAAERIKRASNDIVSAVKFQENAILEKDKLYESLRAGGDDGAGRIASLYSDFMTLQYDVTARYLANKKHPAPKAATDVKELKQTTKEYLYKLKIMQYKYDELFTLFPELEDFADSLDSLKELVDIKGLDQLKEEYDRVRDFISKDEYRRLSESERNQLALDRYIKGQKNSWQVGRDYELYIGHSLRALGFSVIHHGIEQRLGDLGCDIIASRNGVTHIIQCKRWAKDRKIHEKHLMYLYGTYSLLKNDYKGKLNLGLFDERVVADFVSTHEPTDKAKEIARYLSININVMPFQEFPRIKCNIGVGGDKIYHLPFDQQYDTVRIETSKGEFYATNVKEAESKGFRRAHKWKGLSVPPVTA